MTKCHSAHCPKEREGESEKVCMRACLSLPE